MYMNIKKKLDPKTLLMKTVVGNSESFSAKLKLITFNDLIFLVNYITYAGSTVLRDVKKYINIFK